MESILCGNLIYLNCIHNLFAPKQRNVLWNSEPYAKLFKRCIFFINNSKYSKIMWVKVDKF